MLYNPSDYERVRQPYPNIKGIEEPYRSEFRRDYARIIHSPAFRRLEGKTQLFPCNESDFFRNRLTHSLEVAQIGKSIALKLNNQEKEFKKYKIDTDLIETICLAHDIGHPPFGHNGEEALDKCMRPYGGFEGNAQTLRILAKLGKKEFIKSTSKYIDSRVGFNYTYRTLASVLKYDKQIPYERKLENKVKKGYYKDEAKLVEIIKRNVVRDSSVKEFKTIECYIMDVADDIAYSTYDLEDAFKGGFITPLDMISANKKLLEKVSAEITKNIGYSFTSEDVYKEILIIFFEQEELIQENELLDLKGINFTREKLVKVISQAYRRSLKMSQDGYARTMFTSDLVGPFIRGVRLDYNHKHPALSKVYLEDSVFRKVEVLKHFVYQSLIMSPRLEISAYRVYEIIQAIFKALTSEIADGISLVDGFLLLPDDFRMVYEQSRSKPKKMRTICDFIAGMTDQYAIEFYGRLKSENPQTIFKPF